MTLLFVSIVTLALGPVAYRMAHRGRAVLVALDGFVFVAVAGLVLINVLPDAISAGGWITLAFVAVGFAGPGVAESMFRQAARPAHLVALGLGLTGLSLHAVFDGAALVNGTGGGGVSLSSAVVLHRFPAGLAIWWLLRPHFRAWVPTAVLAVVAASTVLGFSVGPEVLGRVSGEGVAWFQALVAGSLLHVVYYRPHLDDEPHEHHTPTGRDRRYEGAGALAGLVLLATLLAVDAGHAGTAGAAMLRAFYGLLLDSAPALLLAYVAAGLVSAFAPAAAGAWMSRGGRLTQAARGMAVGLPLPICSCGVVPLYRTFVGQGASPAAAMAFLVATPELGLDAVFMSVPLLGTGMAAARVAAATVVALLVGWLVGGFVRRTVAPDPTAQSASTRGGWPGRLRSGLRVGLVDVVDDTAPWILAGLGVAAAMTPFMGTQVLASVAGRADVLVFALLGIPVYVCASAATPLVAVLLVGGVSPGAALAFLITGPATNITTFGVLSQLHGRRVAVLFCIAIIIVTVGLGYTLNATFPDLAQPALDTGLTETPTVLGTLALVALAAIFGASLLRRGPRGFMAELKLT